MDFYITADAEQFLKLQKEGFDTALGYWFWNTAVMIAPYDTGNLRSAIILSKNKPRHISIKYDTFMANYALFLEEGIGPVKKYKHFIKGDTTSVIVEQLISWIKTGKRPMFAINNVTPFVQLRVSNKPFSKEKTFLRQANMNASLISAKSRSQISKIRALQYDDMSSIKGKRVNTTLGIGTRSANRGGSQLQNIYKQRVKQIYG